MPRFFYLLLLSLAMLTSSCSESDNTPVINEEFNASNRPYFEYNDDNNQYVLKPWNYDQPHNQDRNYPLVIFLHGHGGAGNISYLNYLGYDTPDTGDDEKALEFQKTNPCFVLAPQTTSFWNNDELIEQVEEFKQKYRIDTNRIYLIGYSMGGSGSYSFINSYFDYNEQLFAGVIRLAGQSQTSVRSAIAEHTAIWLHIGLDDLPLRVDITRQAYDFLKDYHKDATESVSSVPIENIEGKTYTLSIDNKDQFKRTEYDGIGHGIAILPFNDPKLIEWLFSQQLQDN